MAKKESCLGAKTVNETGLLVRTAKNEFRKISSEWTAKDYLRGHTKRSAYLKTQTVSKCSRK